MKAEITGSGDELTITLDVDELPFPATDWTAMRIMWRGPPGHRAVRRFPGTGG